MQTTQKRQIHNPNEAIIAQREREIEDIAQGIIELANIFQDLQTMVIDQGTMLDRIDYNVERMAVDVKATDKELKVATGYQKRTTKRWIILLLLILVAGMFILLLIKPKRRDQSQPSPSGSQVAPNGAPFPRHVRRSHPLSYSRKIPMAERFNQHQWSGSSFNRYFAPQANAS